METSIDVYRLACNICVCVCGWMLACRFELRSFDCSLINESAMTWCSGYRDVCVCLPYRFQFCSICRSGDLILFVSITESIMLKISIKIECCVSSNLHDVPNFLNIKN